MGLPAHRQARGNDSIVVSRQVGNSVSPWRPPERLSRISTITLMSLPSDSMRKCCVVTSPLGKNVAWEQSFHISNDTWMDMKRWKRRENIKHFEDPYVSTLRRYVGSLGWNWDDAKGPSRYVRVVSKSTTALPTLQMYYWYVVHMYLPSIHTYVFRPHWYEMCSVANRRKWRGEGNAWGQLNWTLGGFVLGAKVAYYPLPSAKNLPFLLTTA